jgi:hypothetical protein
VLPDGIRIESGANFLVELNGLAEARLLMAANYDPWHTMTNPGREDLPRLDRRVGMSLAIGEAPFGELTVEVNQPRWARDGREYAPIRFSHSRLPQGTADPDGAGYSSRAMWHVDPETGMVEFRIPWLMLLITDPVDRMVFAGTDSLRVARSKTSPGVAVSVLAFRASVADSMGAPTLELMASLPAESGGRLAPLVYEWKTWERVRYTPYLKPSYYELQSLWRGWPRFMD